MRQSLWYPGARNEFSPAFKGNGQLEINKKVSFLSLSHCLGFHLNSVSDFLVHAFGLPCLLTVSFCCLTFWPQNPPHLDSSISLFLVRFSRENGQSVMNCFFLGQPKSLFGFLHTISRKTQTTFWPSRYLGQVSSQWASQPCVLSGRVLTHQW